MCTKTFHSILLKQYKRGIITSQHKSGIITSQIKKKEIYMYTYTYTLFLYKNTYNLAEPEDVLILAHTFYFLKFGGKSQPQRSYKKGSYKIK